MIILAATRTVEITNRTGLHARPAAKFVEKAGKFDSKIEIISENKEVNAKSIMGVMSLGITRGTKITIKADGTDEKEALEELASYIEEELAQEE